MVAELAMMAAGVAAWEGGIKPTVHLVAYWLEHRGPFLYWDEKSGEMRESDKWPPS